MNMDTIKGKIGGSRLAKNISWIFFGNIFHAVLSFLLNIYVARMLTLNDNGLITYSTSWIGLFTAIGALGFNGVISREFSKSEEKANQYIWSCIWARVLFAVAAIAFLQVIVRVTAPDEPVLHWITLCQSTTILFSSFDIFVYWYRYKNQAKITAGYRLLAFCISAAWRLIGIGVFKNLVIYIAGVSAETFLFVAFLTLFYKRNYTAQIRIDKGTIAYMFKVSYPFIFSSILSTIYGQADKIMLKNMIDNSAVALYNASTTLAGLVVIIPTTLIEGFRPDIMDAKNANENLYQRRLRQLYSIVFWSCVSYGIFITIFAKQIISILYGDKYIGAVSSLSLIVWYTSFSYFGAINNVYMVAEDKQKWVQFTTLMGALANVLMNFMLIPKWGIMGAALSSLITQILANFVLMGIIPDLRKGFFLMIKGIALQDIF